MPDGVPQFPCEIGPAKKSTYDLDPVQCEIKGAELVIIFLPNKLNIYN